MHFVPRLIFPIPILGMCVCVCLDEPEIGDVDEGIVEGGKDTSDAENEFTLADVGAEGDVLLGSTGGFLRRHVGVFWFGN